MGALLQENFMCRANRPTFFSCSNGISPRCCCCCCKHPEIPKSSSSPPLRIFKHQKNSDNVHSFNVLFKCPVSLSLTALLKTTWLTLLLLLLLVKLSKCVAVLRQYTSPNTRSECRSLGGKTILVFKTAKPSTLTASSLVCINIAPSGAAAISL